MCINVCASWSLNTNGAVELYLSVRAFLQRSLHNNMALHAHLQLRDVAGYIAVTGRTQSPQKLAPSDSVHYHSPVLKHFIKQLVRS